MTMVRDAILQGVGAGRLSLSLVRRDLDAGWLVKWGDVEGPDIALWAALSLAPAIEPPGLCVPRLSGEAVPAGPPGGAGGLSRLSTWRFVEDRCGHLPRKARKGQQKTASRPRSPDESTVAQGHCFPSPQGATRAPKSRERPSEPRQAIAEYCMFGPTLPPRPLAAIGGGDAFRLDEGINRTRTDSGPT